MERFGEFSNSSLLVPEQETVMQSLCITHFKAPTLCRSHLHYVSPTVICACSGVSVNSSRSKKVPSLTSLLVLRFRNRGPHAFGNESSVMTQRQWCLVYWTFKWWWFSMSYIRTQLNNLYFLVKHLRVLIGAKGRCLIFLSSLVIV